MSDTYRKPHKFFEKELSFIRRQYWRAHRHQSKINLRKGRDIEVFFNTGGWLTW